MSDSYLEQQRIINQVSVLKIILLSEHFKVTNSVFMITLIVFFLHCLIQEQLSFYCANIYNRTIT